jgi:hypothetical protein
MQSNYCNCGINQAARPEVFPCASWPQNVTGKRSLPFSSRHGILQSLEIEKMSILQTMFVCIFAATLCGCGPSAKQLAEQEAHGKFRDAIAAMKVCTDDATYDEFREKRLALESCYAANESLLTNDATEFNHLANVMKATDILWNYQIQTGRISDLSLAAKGQIKDGYFLYWNAMLVITPEVAAKANFTSEQSDNDPDFYAKNYVRRGLTQIAKQCDAILSQ